LPPTKTTAYAFDLYGDGFTGRKKPCNMQARGLPFVKRNLIALTIPQHTGRRI